MSGNALARFRNRLDLPSVARGWPAALGLAVFTLALWAQPAALVGAFYDDGIYTVLAKALAEGEGYRYIHLPDAPSGVHYPILYPAVLSVLWRIWPAFPDNVALFQVFDSGALALAAWVIATQAATWRAPALVQYVFIPAGFAAFPLLAIVGVRFSEPLFLALCGAAVSLADREGAGIKGAVLAGLFAGLAALTRSIGIAVVVGVVAGIWVRRGIRDAAPALAVAAVPMASWFIWIGARAQELDTRIAANYGTYVTAAQQAGVGGFLEGLDLGALAPLARLSIAVPADWMRYPAAFLLLACLVWGGVIVARRAPSLVATLLAYVGIVMVWPFTPDRFMWVVLPWMSALTGLGLVAAWRTGGGFRLGAALVGAALLAGYLPREVASLANRSFAATAEGISQPSRLLIPSIDAGVPRDAVIAAEGEAMIYLYTGRRSVPNALFEWKGRTSEPLPVEETREYFCDSRVTHISLSAPDSDGAAVVSYLLEKHPAEIRRLFAVTHGPALYAFQCSG